MVSSTEYPVVSKVDGALVTADGRRWYPVHFAIKYVSGETYGVHTPDGCIREMTWEEIVGKPRTVREQSKHPGVPKPKDWWNDPKYKAFR